jgi:two-component system heavy metal sensor histidine kinase CusS
MRKFSITNRLTALYTCATASIITCLTLLLYWVLLGVIHTAEMQYLVDEVHVIQSLLKENNHDLNAIRQEVNAVPQTLKDASYHYYVTILNQNGQPIMQTPGMEKLDIANYPTLKSNWLGNINYWQAHNDTRYMLITGPASYNRAGQVTKIVRIALDISFQDKLLATYWRYAIPFCCLSFLGVFFLGRVITRQGLRPLYQITDITQKVSLLHLPLTQIDSNDWPQELMPISDSYNQMIKHIEEAFNHLSQALNELAHELRTPINNLMGEAEVMIAKPRKVAEYQRVLESSLEEYQRLLRLLDSILLLARVDNPQTKIKPVELDGKQELAKLVDFYQLMAEEKNILISLTGAGNIIADPILLQRVVSNLLANAIQYTPPRGAIHLGIEEKQDSTDIIISDTGIGIPKDFLKQVFERFYRVNSQQPLSGCIGLGLTIVKSIMELHGGEIILTSEVNQGTTVHLKFPKSGMI